MEARFSVAVQAAPFDTAAEIAALSGTGDVGAVVSFSGFCRADKDETGGEGALTALVLEHYPGMAEAEMERLIAQARARWPLLGARIVHRFGRITPGEEIVLVVTASAHRAAAFAAASFLMDWLKTHAPFWKKEERAGGGAWVEAKASDDAAARSWLPTSGEAGD